MPQLDKVSFLSQFFWLCLFFWGFYIAIIKYFLPQMSRVLKYRKKRLQGGSEMSHAHQQSTSSSASHRSTDRQSAHAEEVSLQTEYNEKARVRLSGNKVMEHGYRDSNIAFKHNLQKTDDWLKNSINALHKKEYRSTNLVYLYSLAGSHISHKLYMQKCFLDFSSTIYLSVLKEKIRLATRQKNVS